MAKCAICNKGVYFGKSVSHSHRKSNKIWKSNIKSTRVKTKDGNKRIHVCTSCLKNVKAERV
ncbi:MAG: 50S ribosomal protein L28 [Lachnospiraceae bacterium]|nr:50S ribosomal protein L28 [Lachnospiraceae bacterium]